jgi:hypothetical protein
MPKFKINDAVFRDAVRALGKTMSDQRRRQITPQTEAEKFFQPRTSLALQERRDFERGPTSPLGGRAVEWKR